MADTFYRSFRERRPTAFGASRRRRVEQSRLAVLHRFAGPPGDLGEIGPGDGSLAARAVEAGRRYRAVEASPALESRRGADRRAAPVRTGASDVSAGADGDESVDGAIGSTAQIGSTPNTARWSAMNWTIVATSSGGRAPTHVRSVSAVQPSFGATDCSTAHSEAWASRCSSTIR